MLMLQINKTLIVSIKKNISLQSMGIRVVFKYKDDVDDNDND